MTDAMNGWIDTITSQFIQSRQEKGNTINFLKCSGEIDSIVILFLLQLPR